MTTQAILSGFIAFLVGIVVWLANKLGKRTAQLDAIKEKEKKEQEEKTHAEKITDNVYSMSESDIRNKLHEIANKQQR